MTDYPPGEWSTILVGRYWPASRNIILLENESINFRNIAAAYYQFQDQLRGARYGPLVQQEGLTAGYLRDVFQRGEERSGEIAEKNESKESAFNSVHSSMINLRSELTTVANEGNSKIRQIQNSKDPFPAKVEKITTVVMDCQKQAQSKAVMDGDTIFNAIQHILERDGIYISARQFAEAQGVDSGNMFRSQGEHMIRDHVKGILKPPGSYAAIGEGGQIPPKSPVEKPLGEQRATGAAAVVLQGSQTVPHLMPASPPSNHPVANSTAGIGLGGQTTSALVPSTPAVPAAPQAAPPPVSTPLPSSAPNAPSPLNVPSSPSTSPGLPSQPGARGLIQGVDYRPQTDAPMSATANALASRSIGTTEPHPLSAPLAPQAPATSTSLPNTHVPVFDIPQQAHSQVSAAPPTIIAPTNDAGPTYVPTPAGNAPPMPAAPPPTGSLQAYGADLRLPTPASPPTLPSSPPTAAPASTAINPSATPNGASQPTVVRQPAAPTFAHQTSAGVVERALVASAGGAGAGAASAKATTQDRLQRLVDAAARQEPRLRWAAGDHADGTTVLVTDVASGWIPPRIDIPVGVQLRKPAHRRGDIETLLGEVTAAASYTPNHYVPPLADAEPLATSSRARHVPVVDDLGWELTQATKWRDGLPQLVHTLAKAASRGTGVLDTEIGFLREELTNAGEQVLNSYPHTVEPVAVANWQLLAAISALAESDKAGAHYHFAWFQALNQAGAREGMP